MNERFDRIDQKFVEVDQRFDRVDQKFVEVDQRFDRVDQKFVEVDQRFDRVDQKFVEVDQRFDRIDQKFVEVDDHLDRVEVELRNHMGVLHEEVLDRLAALREPAVIPDDQPAQAKDDIRRRLDPLEALIPVVREHGVTLEQHTAEINRLKRRRK